MSLFVEDNPWIFLIMTVVLGGGAAFLAGRAMARKWRPIWSPLLAMLPLAAGLRFLHYALFQAQLTSLHYFITDFLVLLFFCFLGYRGTLARQMPAQYPWLYEKSGPFGWRNKN
jgi:hypothetical protein